MNRFKDYLGNINHLVDSSTQMAAKDEKDVYVHPKLKNAGCVTIVLIREAIAPVIFRNEEPEITDIEVSYGNERDVHVRAVPNKFKYVERGRGLQILRAYGAGGRMPQNRTALARNQKPSDAFDLNALVFGDSANHDNRVLPVKAAVNYSDALSILPKHMCVDESFHNRAMEDGTLFDAEKNKNSDNLFTRHFILPGTLMIQVLSTRGKVLPVEGLEHLLLSIGLAGAYGGQTSTTGINIKTSFVGMYGSRFEQPEASPYETIKKLKGSSRLSSDECRNINSVINAIHEIHKNVNEISMDSGEVSACQNSLLERFQKDELGLKSQYMEAASRIGTYFDQWFC